MNFLGGEQGMCCSIPFLCAFASWMVDCLQRWLKKQPMLMKSTREEGRTRHILHSFIAKFALFGQFPLSPFLSLSFSSSLLDNTLQETRRTHTHLFGLQKHGKSKTRSEAAHPMQTYQARIGGIGSRAMPRGPQQGKGSRAA